MSDYDPDGNGKEKPMPIRYFLLLAFLAIACSAALTLGVLMFPEFLRVLLGPGIPIPTP